jgi:hypothetical protein
VYRSGDQTSATSVGYSTADITTETGAEPDLGDRTGTVQFAAGQTTATVTVTVNNDTAPETREVATVQLRDPAAGATLGSPDTAGLFIGASDQSLDATVAAGSTVRPSAPWVGTGIHNRTGVSQTRNQSASAAVRQTRIFWVKVSNERNAYNTFTLRGSAPRAGTSVRYFHAPQGSPAPAPVDVTDTMRSAGGFKVAVNAHGATPTETVRDFTRVRVAVTAWKSATVGSRHAATVTSTWRGDVTSQDVVRADVTIAR